MSHESALLSAARRFGWDELRPGQPESMSALLDGHDVLAVMPTGAGKSAIYQLPGLCLDGPTVVVSPLLSLQRDQVLGLLGLGDADTVAVAANSAQSAAQTDDAFDAVRHGDAEFIFLSPEQLAKPAVLERLRVAGPSLVAVDEAHSVSAWGHDFRPDYLRLSDALDALGRPPVVALTATAAPPVRAEIVERLGLRNVVSVVRGFERPNITLAVHAGFPSDSEKRAAVTLAAATALKPAIVYVATRKDTQSYAEALRSLGFSAEAYHAGMPSADRSRVHDDFLGGTLDVVIATNAFGMGIDKPDVRTIVHASAPESLDAYYQEVGRAGRDGDAADALLFFRPQDLAMRRFFAGGLPDDDDIRAVLAQVSAGAATVAEMRRRTGLGSARLSNLLNTLEHAGAVATIGSQWHWLGMDVEAAVKAAREAATSRQAVDKSRIEMMRAYADSPGCRWRFVLAYFGEDALTDCGHCDNCAAGISTPAAADQPFALQSRVTHATWGPGLVMRYEGEQVTVLFDSVGYKTLLVPAVEAQGLLAAG